ncbi:MAG: FIST C-terminal domain-containing protein [Lachnospiraceae bacterium]|nr:FIST C-terminal domain-containing protein [Lachnospiraceae bacterium]
MIRSTTAFTYELDDPALAVKEIITQLKNFELMQNTIGIVLCDTEFINTAIYKEIARALPFPIVGETTMNQAVPGQVGTFLLTLMVLTADDVTFSAGITEEIQSGGEALTPLTEAYYEAAAKLPTPPKLILCFPPYFHFNAGDIYVEAFEKLCPGVPIFGSPAIDDSLSAFDNCSVIYNDTDTKVKMTFVLISGNVHPRFEVLTLTEDSRLPFSGEITKSTKNIVEEINGIPTGKYLEECGLIENREFNGGLVFVPFMVDLKKKEDYDGVVIVRSVVRFDENRNGVFQGNMYQHSVFTLARPTGSHILPATKEIIRRIENMPDANAVLIFACALRRMALGSQALAEPQMINESLSGKVPFLFGDAGGEICPTSYQEGKLSNRFHNFSIVACIL